MSELLQTPLHKAHAAAQARFTPFAGYDMPVQYPMGVLAEHRWTREHAGLFDVSHMGPALLELDAPSGDAEADYAAVAAAFETLVPADLAGLKRGRQRYTFLLNADGGIIDDLMVCRPEQGDKQDRLFLVVNAGTKAGDFALIGQALAGVATITPLTDQALIALQGPDAAAVFGALVPEALGLTFMQALRVQWQGRWLAITRSGYTGEDGFEILVDAEAAPELWTRLCQDERVRPIGLGARDSLRLEAGLPLYGHDMDATVSPVEAGLTFALSKRRLAEGGFPGVDRLRGELAEGPARVRVGLKVQGAPAREGAEIVAPDGHVIGRVTSGGFSPSLSAPIALAFVPPAFAAPGTALGAMVRGKAQPAEVVPLPFVPHRYVRQP
ncbi:MAG TPA: glycine cleavage system aminomethyltransferase GcvT [Caulobacteraceae bacterium]|nr:glycine cleavage system aminomethyltransferase GcvT [Caulobacteraceae bacterium]